MSLIRSIATVGGFTLISRILGFVRDVLIAAFLGAGFVADAFFVAFKLPNLFRRLFAEGAFNAAFVPLFAGKLQNEGKQAARHFASGAFSVLLWALFVFTLLIEISMPVVMHLFAPGFVGNPATFDLAVDLARITFVYLFFISGVSLMAGVLNSLARFAAAAATPILLNLSLIGALIFAVPYLPNAGYALAWGVAVAGILQFLWLFWACARAGFRLRLPRPRLSDDLRRLMSRIVPGAVGAGIYQVNLAVDMIIASLLPAGSISFLFYADRVTQLPLGVVGVATGTALLPALSRQLQSGDRQAADESQNRALEISLLLTLPAGMALAVISEPMIGALFQRGAFSPEDTRLTAAALAVYAWGLPAYVLVKTLTPGFFAREDTATPVKIAAVCMVVNLALNLALMGPFLHLGIAMATVVSAWLNAALLAFLLYRRDGLHLDRRLKTRFPRLLIATASMGGLLAIALQPLSPLLSGGQGARIGALAILVGLGLLSFAFFALVFRAMRLSDLKDLTRGQ